MKRRRHNLEQIFRLLEAGARIEDRRIDYNMNEPHSAHGWLTPVVLVEA